MLLFLHGNPLWSFQYRHIIAPLRKTFRCIALDYPGFGLSEAGPGYTNTLTGNSTLVERFIQTLALSDITLVVFDTSVSIGLGAVARHQPIYPDRGVALLPLPGGEFQFTAAVYGFRPRPAVEVQAVESGAARLPDAI